MTNNAEKLLVDPDFIKKTNNVRKSQVWKWLEAGPGHRFIYGDNEVARAISSIYSNIGLVTDANLSQFDERILSNSISLSAIMGVLPISGMSRAQKLSAESVDVFSFLYFLELEKLSPIFIKGMKEETIENLNWYEDFFYKLGDGQSRRVLSSLVNFRANWDINFLRGFSDRRESQYLEDFLKIGSHDTFFDVGAYSGDSYSAIKNFYGGVKQAVLFEPNPQNRQQAALNLMNDPKVTFSHFALGDQNYKSRIFLSGTSSHVAESGQISVDVRKLDDISLPVPSFIKADIEGFEQNFLVGAKNTISEHRPVLAIAVYHTPAQLRQVVDICIELLPDSQFRLRHYTEGFTETILYALPREKIE